MSNLFDKLFKTKTQQKRFGMLYESFLKSKRRSRFHTEKTYRVKSSTSLIDKSKFLYDIPDSMIFPNTTDIDETEENADVFLKEFGDLLDKDYYLPESILNLLGLSHLIENQIDGKTKNEKVNEDSAKSGNSAKSTQSYKTSNTTTDKSLSKGVINTITSSNLKTNGGKDFNDIMKEIDSFKRKYNTINGKQEVPNTPPKIIKTTTNSIANLKSSTLSSSSSPKSSSTSTELTSKTPSRNNTKTQIPNSKITSSVELEIISKTPAITSTTAFSKSSKRQLNLDKSRKNFPKLSRTPKIKLLKKTCGLKKSNILSANTQRWIDNQSTKNGESVQNGVKSPSLVSKVPTYSPAKSIEVSPQKVVNQSLCDSRPPTSYDNTKPVRSFPKKKKGPQSVDQNQMWKHINWMFTHILNQININSQAHQILVHNAAKFSSNNEIPNNQYETGSTIMFPTPPCGIIGNDTEEFKKPLVSDSLTDSSRLELMSCSIDPFYNQREEADMKPYIPGNFNNTVNNDASLCNTRKPLIFLKNPSLLLKEPEKGITNKSDRSTVITSDVGSKDQSLIHLTESATTTAESCFSAASSSNVPQVPNRNVLQSLEPSPLEQVKEIAASNLKQSETRDNSEAHLTSSAILTTINDDDGKDPHITNDICQIRNDNNNLSEVVNDREHANKISETPHDLLGNALELSQELMNMLNLMKTKKCCDKCSKVSNILDLKDVSADHKVSILQSLYRM